MSADDQRAAEAEYERLRTELAETRTVGDALAAAVTTWLTQGPDGPMGKTMLCPLVDVWNEVRGDAPAPAEPPADPEPTRWSTLDDAMRVAHERPLISSCTWHSRSECVCPVHDVVRRLSDAGMLRDAAPAATPEPPAVELPVTLSSVDDVAAVCAFLDISQVRERTWYCNPQVTVWAAGTCDEGTGGVEIDSVPLHLDVQFPAATSLVVAAIEAARGGSR